MPLMEIPMLKTVEDVHTGNLTHTGYGCMLFGKFLVMCPNCKLVIHSNDLRYSPPADALCEDEQLWSCKMCNKVCDDPSVNDDISINVKV